jgi:glycogen debranching enzyme
MLTILEGDTFCMSDAVGDITEMTHGLFANDTRMLSRLRLLVDGAQPLLLTSKAVEYFTAAHYARNAPTDHLPADTVSISRERFIGRGLTDRIVLRNEGMMTVAFPVDVAVGSDFADIISVKSYDFSFGDPEHAAVLPPERKPMPVSPESLRIEDDEGFATLLTFSPTPVFTADGARYELVLAPHARWELTMEISFPTNGGEVVHPAPNFGTELEHVRESLRAWKLRVPRLTTEALDLSQSYHRSLADLASLRIRGHDGIEELPAAGMPWFMTVFGRDTLITSLQTLLYGPELAAGALRALAALQATEDVPELDAEPGKILHELRRGRAATMWFPVYYGSIDATPLFLVLLSELWRWTGDDAIVEELKGPALAALEWVERHGDTDGDGFLEYKRRTQRGLENQSWKDSGDSQRFADGRMAEPPIAPVEVQGYAYDARRRTAELARAVWGEPELARRLDADADLLARRFDEAFWVDERQMYALALDGSKNRVDSLCSNIGHLLWSGIVPEGRRAAIATALTSEGLWSGWGIRTMGLAEAAYNPLSYHNGTVWPHDSALAAWGLARAGYWEDCERLARSLIEASSSFDYSLPEVFAGFARDETAFPIAYPTAARPQAWAAGAPVLCLTLLLGLRPDPAFRRLVSDAPSPPPRWLVGTRLDGVRAFGESWTVEVGASRIEIERMLPS